MIAEESHHHERNAEEGGDSPQAGEHPATSPDRKSSRRPFKAVEFVENKLVSVVEECLREATHKSQRKEILKNLFVDLSQKIEPQYRGTINASSQSPYQYYYELIADYYHRNPSAALDLQPVCQELIFNFHFPAIFALIFHKWLFSSTHPNLTLSRYNLFLKGANRLFWNDLENKEFTYRRIYKFLKYDVALNKYVDQMFLKVLATAHEYSSLNSDNESSSEAETMIQEHKQMEGESENYITSLFLTKKLDLIGIIGKYFFFYELQTGKKYFYTYVQLLAEKHSEHLFPKVTDVSQLDSTVKVDMQSENTTEEQKQKVLQMITDLFIQENILLLSSIHSEETLLELLEDFKNLVESKMSSKMRVKLQATLYSMSCPGGPAYPTRNIRHKAKEVLDTLFPNGKMARFMINTGFRVLHQYTWPRSLWHYLTQKFWGLISFPFSVLAWVKKTFQFSPLVAEEMGKNESKKHAS